MAKNRNLYLRGNTYYYNFTLNGIQFRGSCRTDDIAVAQQVYEAEYKKILLGGYGIKKVPTLKEMSEKWLDHFENKHSDSHLRTGKVFYDTYLIPSLGKYQMDKIDAEMWNEAFKDFTKDKSESTYNCLIKYFNILNNYAVELGFLKSVTFKPKAMRVQKRNRPIVIGKDLSSFLKQTRKLYKSKQVHIMVEMALFTGMRESEIIHATWTNLDEEYKTYTVAPSETKDKTKNKRIRVIDLPESLFKSIIEYKETHKKKDNDLMFPSRDGNPHCRSFLTLSLYAICKRMGIEKLSAHRMRASFITAHARLGTPIVTIQKMVGHEDLETTARYLEDNQEARIEAQAKLSKLA